MGVRFQGLEYSMENSCGLAEDVDKNIGPLLQLPHRSRAFELPFLFLR
jgi:hypothetical protein